LPAPEARPFVNPCERSWAADVGVGRLAAGVVGVAGILGVLGIEAIPAGRNAEPPVPDIPETGLIGAETAGVGLEVGLGRVDESGRRGNDLTFSVVGEMAEAPSAA
jgi:hypothetical protein